MGVVQLKVKGEINDLVYGVETKVKAKINLDVWPSNPGAFF